jgi:AraC family transcriptional regulator
MQTAETEYTGYAVATKFDEMAFLDASASTNCSKRTKYSSECTAPGAFSDHIASHFHIKDAPSITVNTRGNAKIVVTHLRSDEGLARLSESLPAEEAFIVFLHLREVAFHQWRVQENPKLCSQYIRGGIGIVDLSAGPVSLQSSPFDCLHFYIPRAALDEIADENGAHRVRTLICPEGTVDSTIYQLGLSILEAMEAPEDTSKLFLQHAVLALNARFACIYGHLRIDHARIRGGLAPWQVRRAKALLMQHLEGGGCLTQIARQCDLSASHFARAFKQTIGQAPYQWLGQQRIKFARNLLLHSETPMTEIASKCGFADQACFTRAFKRVAGSAPGEWRRANRNSGHTV